MGNKLAGILKGILGIILILFGLNLFIGGLFSLIFSGIISPLSSLLGYVGIEIPICIFGALGMFVIGLIILLFGLKLFFDNESAIIRGLLGIIGIIWMIFGLAILLDVAFSTSITIIGLAIAIVGIFVHLSVSVSLIAYAFPIKPLKFFRDLLGGLKSVLDILPKL